MSAVLAAPPIVEPTSSFERHGIAHLSPSSLNLFAAQPAMWVMEKLLKRRGQVGCAAHRGTAAEAGIVHGLLQPDAAIEDCQAVGLLEFDRVAALSGDPKRQKERDAVSPIVATGIATLRKAGIPDEVQVKVCHRLADVPVPVLGYLDIGWSKIGLRVDIKSQLAVSTTMKAGHARQIALYVHDTNYVGKIAYVGPSKINVLTLADPRAEIEALRQIALRLERFLAITNDPEMLAGIVVPDFEAFWWNDPTTRAMGREVFGF
jgi:hypothetical protein